MIKFSKLLVQLIYCSSNNEKVKIIINYLNKADIQEAGFAIAALTNNLKFKNVKNKTVKEIINKKIDKTLFDLSYDYTGDLADTISLIWDKTKSNSASSKSIVDVVKQLNSNNTDLEKYITDFLDSNYVDVRWAFIKLLLGGFRVGVSANLIKKTLAVYGNKNKDDIEKIWNGLSPPYLNLIKWLKNEGEYPQIKMSETFHSMMLANSIDLKKDLNKINLNEYLAEYKWDGIRVQIVCKESKTKIYTRTGEDITYSFPEIILDFKELVVLDGELLAGKNFTPTSFGELQKRLNKKNPSKKLLFNTPVFVRLYDILFYKEKDIRNKNLLCRKKSLYQCYADIKNNINFDLSEMVKFCDYNSLNKIYENTKTSKFIEGLMIKKKTSLYVPGRRKNLWLKWKRSPRYIDVIIMYAQRGHGKRSSFYSDFTLGIFNNNNIVPIAKAYSGYTDKELKLLDKFVRNNTIKKFGPVREVKKILVVELAFDSMQESNRHKSGISLRFPRFHRIRWDKPSDEILSLDQIKLEFMN